MDRKERKPSQMLTVGEKAPAFSLLDQSGNTVTLDEYRGKKNIVLIFYPGDHTPGCKKQLCAVRDQFKLFTNSDTAVFGVNTQGAESHQGFAHKHDFPFPLLVDGDKGVVSAYGCKGLLVTKRTVYGIDKEGTIVFASRGMPANEEVLDAFKE